MIRKVSTFFALTIADPVDSTIATNKHQRFVYDKYLCIQRLNGTNNAVTDLFEWDPTEPVATRPLYWQPRTAEGNCSLFYTHDGNKNVSEAVFYQRALRSSAGDCPQAVLDFSRRTV